MKEQTYYNVGGIRFENNGKTKSGKTIWLGVIVFNGDRYDHRTFEVGGNNWSLVNNTLRIQPKPPKLRYSSNQDYINVNDTKGINNETISRTNK